MLSIASNGYAIAIGTHSLKKLNAFLNKQRYSSYFILCDENTLKNCLPTLITSCSKLSTAEIIEIESGEDSKSLELSALIWQTFLEQKADKNSLLVNLGGGVVSDLGGFTASVYKRGIDFVNIPTSLLAMADASVGGKTGIDFNGIKNSIGTFAQPKAVFVNPDFLQTLPDRHFKNGLAELFKIALVNNKPLWNNLKTASFEKDAEKWIGQSISLKNKIVLKDPFDKGMRKSLNFGHTIGHAIEACLLNTPNELLHGESVVIGMILESYIALRKKLISIKEFSEISDVLFSVFTPKALPVLSIENILELVKNDKKNSGSKILFSLVNPIGKCLIDVPVNEMQIKKALVYYNQRFA